MNGSNGFQGTSDLGGVGCVKTVGPDVDIRVEAGLGGLTVAIRACWDAVGVVAGGTAAESVGVGAVATCSGV